ncbi:MAG: hypothetical protein ACYDDF_05615 [Thermoplasmatota archaeon]
MAVMCFLAAYVGVARERYFLAVAPGIAWLQMALARPDMNARRLRIAVIEGHENAWLENQTLLRTSLRRRASGVQLLISSAMAYGLSLFLFLLPRFQNLRGL